MRSSLWRLENLSPATITRPAALTDGLRLHIRYVELQTVLVQVGDLQRVYLMQAGCPDCARERCQPGCWVLPLRRLFHAVAPTVHLVAVPDGLAARPYTRGCLALPTRSAEPLQDSFLMQWPEARLLTRWRARKNEQHAVGATLLTGAAGPELAKTLRQYGWRSLPLAGQLIHRLSTRPIPRKAPLLVRWDHEPYLPIDYLSYADEPGAPASSMTPLTGWRFPVSPDIDQCMSDDDAAMTSNTVLSFTHAHESSIDAMLASWLMQVLHTPEVALREAAAQQTATTDVPLDDTQGRWPIGPLGVSAALLAELIPQLLAEPIFRSERKGQSGITKGRLVGLRHQHITDATARALMVWFDQASILETPENGQNPWRTPRPFATTDLEQIATQLRDTPLPTTAAIRAAYGGEA